MVLGEILLLLIPLVVVQIVLVAWALKDLSHPERRVRGGNKVVWVLVIVFFELFGPLVYFFAGREET